MNTCRSAVAALLLVTGPHLADLYRTQIENCAANHDCATAQTTFLRTDRSLFNILGFLVLFMPAVLGVFLGAPLVARELETGTFRLAWTQSVGRTRWLAVKIAMVGLAGMAVAGLVSLFVTWWAHPLDRVQMAQYTYFDQRSVVPVAYAAFAIALGVACGIFLRRTLPAMASTLAGFVGVRLAFVYYVRSHLLPTSHLNTSLSSGNGLGFEITPPHGIVFVANNPTIPNAMVLSSHIADASGHTAGAQTLHAFLASQGAPWSSIHRVLRAPADRTTGQVIRLRSTTASSTSAARSTLRRPTSRPPTTGHSSAPGCGIFMAAALILAGASLWRIRRS